MTDTYKLSNPFFSIYRKKTDVILLSNGLTGTVRGKSANGLIIHNEIFNVVAIVDKFAAGKLTSEICQGVDMNIPIYPDVDTALDIHRAKALILLSEPAGHWHTDIKTAISGKMDIINTSFSFVKDIDSIKAFAAHHGIRYFDLRDVADIKAYPNTEIVNRRAKVIYVTGTDCGLGKRTAAYELLKEARRRGINAAMYATGQTGLMLGEDGTVVDALTLEFSNGVVSQHICEMSKKGIELIFVEGQSDIFHPAYSSTALAILHGSNPDGIVLVHDENRKNHKGFEEGAELYKMHSVNRYIRALETMSLACGPVYKTIGIATIGENNIEKIKTIVRDENMVVEDMRTKKGPVLMLDRILKHCHLHDQAKNMTFIKNEKQLISPVILKS